MTMLATSRLIERLLARRMFWLLVVLILVLLLTPIIDANGGSSERLYLVILTTVLLVSAVHAAGVSRLGRTVGLILAVVWVSLAWFRLFSGKLDPTMWSDVALMVLLFYVLSILIARTVALKATDFDSLCGAVAAYFMIATAWAVSYRVIEIIAPGSFLLDEQYAGSAGGQLLYFSLTTITTLGYGDVTPVSPFARIWSTLEASAGVLYVALLIARLMSVYRN
jgi:hypothetical protein